jgi:hypothetical protein
MGVEMITTEDLIREAEEWIAEGETKIIEMSDGSPEHIAFNREMIDTTTAIVERLKKNRFLPTQAICVLSLQALMQGPEYIEKMTNVLTGLLSGQYVAVATENMQALMGAPAGRA